MRYPRKPYVRERRESQGLQILIVDAELNGEGMRIVVTHGDPYGNATKKLMFLEGVRRAVGRVEKADKDEKRPQRKYIWMGDHNMVLDPGMDQGEGQPTNARQKEVAGLAIAIERELGVTDAFRWLHPQERAYTRGTRRIDRIAIPIEWATTNTPCVSEARHIEREEVELVLAKSKGKWRMKRPDHKAVEIRVRYMYTNERRAAAEWKHAIRVRYTNERRAAAEWKHAGTYPKEIQEEVRKIITDTLTDKRITTEEVKLGIWQKKVKDRLMKHEKDTKKECQKKRQVLRGARDIWLARAREKPGNTKAISIAARFQDKMDRGKIEQEKKKADVYREREWAKETRNTKSLFAKLKEQIMQTDITALGKEETENTPARGAAQTAEEHMEKCFNVHKTNDAGKSEGEKDERTAAKKETHAGEERCRKEASRETLRWRHV